MIPQTYFPLGTTQHVQRAASISVCLVRASVRVGGVEVSRVVSKAAACRLAAQPSKGICHKLNVKWVSTRQESSGPLRSHNNGRS
jgi:hypothetical protein